jgi:hypothetical protein
MALFSIPELREQVRNSQVTVAISYSDLGVGDATHILSEWALELISFASQNGFNVVVISGTNLTYERMTEILTATKPAILFNFSHGCQTYLMGNPVNGVMRCTLTRGWEDPLCGLCGMPGNLSVAHGMAIVAYSCHSAYQLGKCAIKFGSPNYIGFSDSLIVVSDRFGTQDIYKESLLPLAKRILEGWTAGAAVEATRSDLFNNIKLYKPVELISVPLWYNRKYLEQLGDPNWKLF